MQIFNTEIGVCLYQAKIDEMSKQSQVRCAQYHSTCLCSLESRKLSPDAGSLGPKYNYLCKHSMQCPVLTLRFALP